jgi:glycosyltransferase involved in cell wall biosynthesis
MVLGLLPSIRGGLGELARTGQHSRLIEGYFKPYAGAFEEVRYFSYLDESLGDYTRDPELTARVRLFPGGWWHPWVYAFLMPIRYRRQFSGCAVLRVFQVTGVIPALLAKRLFGVPFVTTYGFWYSGLARSTASRLLRRAVEKVGLAAADAVIVTTPELGAHVAERAGEEKVHLIPNGVDTGLFRPVAREPRQVKKVLYVGRLAQEKNLDALVAAAGKLISQLPLQLAFIGDGSVREKLEVSAKALRVPAEFLPFVDHRRLPDFFHEADAFVLPSFTEGHPKVLLEAMSSGVPCVASARGGNLDIVVDGKTGLLFDPDDSGALADRLERVLTSNDLARSLATEARAAIVERYDLRALVRREIDLLKRVGRGGLCD